MDAKFVRKSIFFWKLSIKLLNHRLEIEILPLLPTWQGAFMSTDAHICAWHMDGEDDQSETF